MRQRVSAPEFIAWCCDTAHPGLTQNALCIAVGMDCDVNPETVRRWLKGVTRPKFSDLWPVFFVAITEMTPDSAEEVATAILGGD